MCSRLIWIKFAKQSAWSSISKNDGVFTTALILITYFGKNVFAFVFINGRLPQNYQLSSLPSCISFNKGGACVSFDLSFSLRLYNGCSSILYRDFSLPHCLREKVCSWNIPSNKNLVLYPEVFKAVMRNFKIQDHSVVLQIIKDKQIIF